MVGVMTKVVGWVTALGEISSPVRQTLCIAVSQINKEPGPGLTVVLTALARMVKFIDPAAGGRVTTRVAGQNEYPASAGVRV